MEKNLFIPSLAATDYHFCIQENGEDREVTIKRIGTFFYRKEEGANSLAPLGDFKDLITWLYERQAVWQSVKEGKRNPKLFYDTAAAMYHLVTGGSVYSLEMKTTISYDDAYQGLYTADHQQLAMLPSGVFTVAFLEPMKAHTKKEVNAREQMKREPEEISAKDEVQNLRDQNRQLKYDLCQTKDMLKHASKQAEKYREELEANKKAHKEEIIKVAFFSGFLHTVIKDAANEFCKKYFE